MTNSKPAMPVPNTARVPSKWRNEVASVLITRREIERRLRVMAREIQRDFSDNEMVVVSLLNGTIMFLADLVRHLSLPLRLDFIGVSTYRTSTESGDLVFTKDLRLDVRPVQADYVGFEIPDVFVVGYGLDFAERFRNLPFVGVLQARVYAQSQSISSQTAQTGSGESKTPPPAAS